MKLKETIMIAIAALAFMLITGIAKANPVTNWLTNEKNKIVEYQKTNWQKGKEQTANNWNTIKSFFSKVVKDESQN
jgi:Na+/glutamate symporter